MDRELLHNRWNAAYFSFAALSFVALLGSLWWGGVSFLYATPLNAILVLLGLVYICAALLSLRHAFCSPISWLGCSCGGRSRKSLIRSIAMLLPLPIFAYFLYGTMVKLTFDDSERSFENVKAQLELDRTLFGHVRGEGITWRLARKAFKQHYDVMGDRIVCLLLKSMVERGAEKADLERLLLRHARFHNTDACIFTSITDESGKTSVRPVVLVIRSN